MSMKPEHLIDCCERFKLPKPKVRNYGLLGGAPCIWAEWTGEDVTAKAIAALIRHDGAVLTEFEIDVTVTDEDGAQGDPMLSIRLTGPMPADAWTEIDRRAAEPAGRTLGAVGRR